MNDFGFVDFRKPIDDRDDFRTSTYRGHHYMTDTMFGNKLHVRSNDTQVNVMDPFIGERSISAMKAAYIWKYPDPNAPINPTVPRGSSNVKSFADCDLRFTQRPIRPACSVSHQDYTWNPPMPKDPQQPIPMSSGIESTKIIIDRAKPGTVRLLDSAVTTTKVDYVHYTPQQIMNGVSANDCITFWNWERNQNKRVFHGCDMEQCNYSRATDCTQRRHEYPSQVKYVPNAGLTTEARVNYGPVTKKTENDINCLRNDFLQTQFEATSKNTEYQIYGSGNHTRRFV